MENEPSIGKDLLDPGDQGVTLAGKEITNTEVMQDLSSSGDWGDDSFTEKEGGVGDGGDMVGPGEQEGTEKPEIDQVAPSSSVEQDSGNPGS